MRDNNKLTSKDKKFLKKYLHDMPDGNFKAKKIYDVYSDGDGDAHLGGKKAVREHAIVYAVFFQTEFQGHGRYLTAIPAHSDAGPGGKEELRAFGLGDPFEMPRVALDCVEDFIGEKYVVLQGNFEELKKTPEELIEKFHVICNHNIRRAASVVGQEEQEAVTLFTTPEEMDAFIENMEVVKK